MTNRKLIPAILAAMIATTPAIASECSLGNAENCPAERLLPPVKSADTGYGYTTYYDAINCMTFRGTRICTKVIREYSTLDGCKAFKAIIQGQEGPWETGCYARRVQVLERAD